MSEAAPPSSPEAQSETAAPRPLTEPEPHPIVEATWRTFSSPWVGLVSFVLLAAATIANGLVTSGDGLGNLERGLGGGSFSSWAYRAFELYDADRSWWFALLIVISALCLVAGSIERLPRLYLTFKRPALRLDDVRGVAVPTAAQKTKKTEAEVRAALEQAGYAVVVTPRPEGADLFAEKGVNARLGVWALSLAGLLLLAAAVASRALAFEGAAVVPGNGGRISSISVRGRDGSELQRGLGFLLQVNDFRVKEGAPGVNASMESDLSILSSEPGSDGKVLLQRTLTAIEPLKFDGMTFTQVSYRQLEEGQRAQVALVDKVTGREREMKLGPGETLEAAEGLMFQIVDYQENFANMGPAVQVMRVEEPPGALVAKTAGPRRVPSAQAKLTSFWIFANKPDFDRDNRTDRFALKFGKVAPVFATILKVSRDPGLPLAYAGCLLGLAGLLTTLFTAHKRIWARLDAGRIAVGGSSHHHNQTAFRQELDQIRKALGVQVEPKRPAPDGSTA